MPSSSERWPTPWSVRRPRPWSAVARTEDVDCFLDHMVRHGVEQPAERIDDIVQAIRILPHRPLLGRPVAGGRRELVIGQGRRSHVALYRVARAGHGVRAGPAQPARGGLPGAVRLIGHRGGRSRSSGLGMGWKRVAFAASWQVSMNAFRASIARVSASSCSGVSGAS